MPYRVLELAAVTYQSKSAPFYFTRQEPVPLVASRLISLTITNGEMLHSSLLIVVMHIYDF